MHFSKSVSAVCVFSVAQFVQQSTCSQLFSDPNVSISEAPSANQFDLNAHPNSNTRTSRSRQRFYHQHGKGSETLKTLFSGVYPILNITWLGHKPQTFAVYVDTGSSDTGIISKGFQCLDMSTQAPIPESGCGFGPLYDPALGSFTNITSEQFAIQYFPENASLSGSMGYAPLKIAGLTVPKQEVALVSEVAWAGADNVTSGLIGLAYPRVVAATFRSNGSQAVYDPIFTTMVKEGIVKDAVFTIAINRVRRGTSAYAPAGTIAFGGLVAPEYYVPPFTSVGIEQLKLIPDLKENTFYALTHELIYAHKNGSIVSGGTYQSIVDTGTSSNFVPTAAAVDINAQFSPPAVFNATLDYYTVDCNARAPSVAFKISGKIMPMDPRDMIDRSLTGLPGYENVCFSAFSDGGDPSDSLMIIGSVWQKSYVIAFDVGRSMLHFADRRPY